MKGKVTSQLICVHSRDCNNFVLLFRRKYNDLKRARNDEAECMTRYESLRERLLVSIVFILIPGSLYN